LSSMTSLKFFSPFFATMSVQPAMSAKLFLKLSLCALWGSLVCACLDPPMVDKDEDMTVVDMPPDMPSPMPGDTCRVPSDCGDELLCAGNGTRFECMTRCRQPGTRCEGGEVCTGLDVGGTRDAICYRGGATARGESCSTNLECEAGNLCFGDGMTRYCLEACHVDTPECSQIASRCVLAADGQTSGYCQPTVGGSCDMDTGCEGGAQLTCSPDLTEDVALLRQIFPSAACTQVGCASDQACGPQGRCARVMQSTGAQAVCMRGCAQDSQCRFQVNERCWSESDCAGRADEASCAALLSASDLCLPVAMSFTWP
jgi:hypothetical protein